MTSFLISIVTITALETILGYKLFLESSETFFDAQIGYMLSHSKILLFKQPGESAHISREIVIDEKPYRVVRYAKGFIPKFEQLKKREMPPLTGYLVLNGKTLTPTKENLSEVLRIFLLWHYSYIKPILGKKISYNKFDIKRQLGFLNAHKKIIERRNYSKIFKKHGKEYTGILKELDQEVLKQYPLRSQKLNLQLEILDNLYDMFRKPSDKLFNSVLEKIRTIKHLSGEENAIWNKRLTTWKKLTTFYHKKLKELPKPSIASPLAGLFGTLLSFVYFKSFKFEIVITTLFGEIGKVVLKISAKAYVNVFLYHKFGIDAIKKNIKINREIINLANMYDTILKEEDLQKVRN